MLWEKEMGGLKTTRVALEIRIRRGVLILFTPDAWTLLRVCNAKQAVMFMRFAVICVRFAVICMRFAVQNRRRYKTRQHKILEHSSASTNSLYYVLLVYYYLLLLYMYSRRQSTVAIVQSRL